MSREEWSEGLSRTSIGRFGGLRDDLIPCNNGYVTATGPVLECFLASMAPLLLVPRDARFLGAVWDDQAKALKLRLSGGGQNTAQRSGHNASTGAI